MAFRHSDPMQLTHDLVIDQEFAAVQALHGTVRLPSGWRGVCSCGARSPLYGITDPVRLWHAWHLDPTGRKARAQPRAGVR